MDQKKGKLKRGMGILLAAVMVFNILPVSGFAVSASENISSAEETGLCEHHPEHTAECGYSRAAEGAVAQVETDGNISYYDTIDAAWTAANGNTATITLLADVTASGTLTVDNGSTITFEGGSHTLTSGQKTAIEVNGTLKLVSGTIHSTYSSLNATGINVHGTLEMTGGTVTTSTSYQSGFKAVQTDSNSNITISGGKIFGIYGISVNGGTVTIQNGENSGKMAALDVNNGNVTIEGGTFTSSDFYGMKVENGTVVLRGGTFTGGGYAIRTPDSVASLLDKSKLYVYFDANGQPVNLSELEDTTKLPEGTYTVGECTHPGVKATPNNDGTHSINCPYCGYTETAADCAYSFSGNVGTCPDCRDTLTVSVADPGKLTYDGTAKTLEVTVKRGEQKLTAGTDYTVTYASNKDAGTNSASVTVTIGSKQGTYTKTFSIDKATPTIAWSNTSQELTYAGKTDDIYKPTVTLVNGETFSGTINYSYTGTFSGNGLPTNAGTYTIMASIAANGNYTGAESANTLTLTINKVQGTLTVPETSINKKFGDAEFSLNCSTNGDGKISYESSDESVATVSADGNVLIKGVGKTEITASLAEGKNYTGGASRKITVTVEKAAAPAIMDEIKQYISTKGSGGGAAVMDVAGKLPDNRGKTAYNASVISDNASVLSDVAVDKSGNLTYKVKSGKEVNSEADIKVTIEMANYETAVFTLKIKIVEKIQVEITAKPENAVYDGSGHKGYADGITCDYPVEGYTFTYTGRESTEYNSSEPPKEAGSYTVTISVSDKSGDYYEKSVSLDFIIEKASVAIKADDKTVKTGDPLPKLTYTVSGLAEKDSLAAAPEITCDADTKTEGSYPITVRGAKVPDTKNYNEEIIYEEGTLTVLSSSTSGASGGNSTGGTDTPQNPQAVPCAQVKSVKLSKTVYTYTGKAKKPSVIAVDTEGKQISGKYYTVSYKNNKKVGKATVTVKFKGSYSGSVTKTFTIRPAGTSIKKLTAVSNGFTVKWAKKTTQTSGYQIQYSANAGFEGNSTCSVFVKKTSVTKQTVKKLKAGKKYYVRIRTYKTVKTGEKSIRIYSAWSRAVRVKTLPAAPEKKASIRV